MTELQFNQMNESQRKMVAIAFLMDKPQLRPESTGRFFDKLNQYDKSAREINSAIHQAQKSVQELRKQLDQIIGSINAVSGLIAEELPIEKLQEWCMQFELDEKQAPQANVAKPSNAPDIAGATARNLKPPILPAR